MWSAHTLINSLHFDMYKNCLKHSLLFLFLNEMFPVQLCFKLPATGTKHSGIVEKRALLLTEAAEKVWTKPTCPQIIREQFTAWYGNYTASSHKAPQRVLQMVHHITDIVGGRPSGSKIPVTGATQHSCRLQVSLFHQRAKAPPKDTFHHKHPL